MIFCFDCDRYDTNPDDRDFLNSSRKFCKEKGYEYIWFCRDIESVFLGRKISDKQKKREAVNYKAKNLVMRVDKEKLSQKDFGENKSNILIVLDKFIPSIERKE